VRIWSAGCAHGQEPYSLAMALHQRGLLQPGQLEILGTDLSSSAIEAARDATYGDRALRNLPSSLRERYFEQSEPGQFQLAETIHTQVRFRQGNVLDPELACNMHPTDVILCRNLFIHFGPAAIARALEGFATTLVDGGYVVLTASESLGRPPEPFRRAGAGQGSIYRKQGAETATSLGRPLG
jgi:chemotaxis protein methyltransferase CheR